MQELSVLPLLRAGFNRVSRGLKFSMSSTYAIMLIIDAVVVFAYGSGVST